MCSVIERGCDGMVLQINVGNTGKKVKTLKLTQLDEDAESYIMEVDDGDTEYVVFVPKSKWKRVKYDN